MKTLRRIANVLFGCAHPRTTFPQRPRGGTDEEVTVSCLDCGARLHYSWEEMKIGNQD